MGQKEAPSKVVPAAAEGAEASGAPAAGGEGVSAASFEASAQRLAAIVHELERGELPLERSLELFEEGIRVARAAQARLEQAEQRVEELLGLDEQGRPQTREIDL
ncbi:MAG: exodeoxyribonuclease VII small subunit [Deltaproteobacteria bacterium]|nr:exodeoxyribonuclease VII small subunit [Deltaproteobacteria bacterium]